jgi:hypothetical protein
MKQIAIKHIIAVIVLNVFITLAEVLYSPDEEVFADVLFQSNIALGIMIAIFNMLVILALGIYLLRVLWNNFLCQILKLREITVRESTFFVLFISAIIPRS